MEIAACVYNYVINKTNITSVRTIFAGRGTQQNNKIFISMCMIKITPNRHIFSKVARQKWSVIQFIPKFREHQKSITIHSRGMGSHY